MTMIPSDPFILLSYVNTQLRDGYPSLDEFCAAQDLDLQALTAALAEAGFAYDAGSNQFK